MWFPEIGTTSILKHDPVSLQNLVETKQTKNFDLSEGDNTVFKILVIFIICHDKLRQRQQKGTICILFCCPVNINVSAKIIQNNPSNPGVSSDSATTIIIAIISRTIECVVSKMKEVLPPLPSVSSKCTPSEEADKETQKCNRRRRRRRGLLRTVSLSEDELSEDSKCFSLALVYVKKRDSRIVYSPSGNASEEYNSDTDSEENLIFDEYSDEELFKSPNVSNGHSDTGSKGALYAAESEFWAFC